MSQVPPTLQTGLEVLVLIILLRLSKRILGHRAQVEARLYINDMNLKHSIGYPLPDYVGAYVSPRLLRCCHLSHYLPHHGHLHAVNFVFPDPLGVFTDVSPDACCCPHSMHSIPGPLPLYFTNAD